MYLGGWYGKWDNGTKPMTWIRKLAVLWGHHTLLFEAREGASSDYGDGYMAKISLDGESISLDSPSEKITVLDGAVELAWVEGKTRSGGDYVDVYDLRVSDVLRMRMTLRPEVKILRRADDGLVHFTVDVLDSAFSSNVHGVLGQTFRPDFVGRLAKQKLVHSDLLKVDMVPGDNAEGFIGGVVEDYQVSAILRSDCKLCRFARATAVDEETARALALSGSATSSFSVTPRKALLTSR